MSVLRNMLLIVALAAACIGAWTAILAGWFAVANDRWDTAWSWLLFAAATLPTVLVVIHLVNRIAALSGRVDRLADPAPLPGEAPVELAAQPEQCGAKYYPGPGRPVEVCVAPHDHSPRDGHNFRVPAEPDVDLFAPAVPPRASRLDPYSTGPLPVTDPDGSR